VPIEPGTKLGQYEVKEFMGEGAMGTVYRAYHEQLARTGAVKVMHAISPDKDSIARFRHEAQAIARMRHPNILNVFDFGEYQGAPYMIVEYVPGGNLAGRMSQGPLDRATALRFLRGIAAGLDYAHSQGIVHRDVKPANVLLEKDETPVLADFGLAKMLQGSSLKSLTGVTTGTPAYMAPEQVTGHQVGPAADRYSLATIAYEMLTGSIPFEGLGVLEVMYAHVHLDPARPSSLKSELNESVDAVIMRGLAKEPASRWGNCEAFVTALALALGAKAPPGVERTVAFSPPVASFETTDAFAPPPTTVPSPVWPPPAEAALIRRSRTKRYVIAAIAVPVLLALVVGVVAYFLADAFKPTLSLSTQTVRAGESLTVSASHLPANQGGEIQLHSVLQAFPFTADTNGNVKVEITVPPDSGVGDHIVQICWNGSCPVETVLQVTNALPSPIPSSTPSASPATRPSITLSTTSARIGGPVTISGRDFDSGKLATIAIYQNAKPHLLVSPPIDVRSNGTFVVTVTIPSDLIPGAAEIVACIYSGITVQPTSSQCTAKPLRVQR
jgi:serine/threonine-protein kinase